MARKQAEQTAAPTSPAEQNTHLLIFSTRDSFRRAGLVASKTPSAIAIADLSPAQLADLEARNDEFFSVRRITKAEAESMESARSKGESLDGLSVAQIVQENDRLRAENLALKADVERLTRDLGADRPPKDGEPVSGAAGGEPPLPIPGPGPGQKPVANVEAAKSTTAEGRNPLP